MKRLTVSLFLFIFLGWMIIPQTNITWNNIRIIPKHWATVKVLEFLFDKVDEGEIKKGACILYQERLYIPVPDGIDKKERIYALRIDKLEAKKEEEKKKKGKERKGFQIIRIILENEANSLDFRIEVSEFDGKKEGEKPFKIWKMRLKPGGKENLWYLIDREPKRKE